MVSDSQDPRPDHDSFVRGGPSHHLALRLGFEPPSARRRALKVLLLILVTWVPLLLFSLVDGDAFGGRVAVPLLRDPVIYSRFLFVVPLLALAEVVVERSLSTQARYFLESGIVPEREHPRFQSAKAEVTRLRNAVAVELAILVLAFVFSVGVRLVIGASTGGSNWRRSGRTITLAGWWHILVSLPILFFFLARWIWVLLVWTWFLFRVSRLDLELTPTHPDRAGGLGFLGWGLASFAPVLLAVSAVMSGGFADEILHRGSSLNILKYHVVVFVILAVAILHAPLFVFSGRLIRCRFRALLEFGALIWRHDRAFDEKWINPPHANAATPLGSPDVSTLADIAAAFEHIERMQFLPFDKKALGVLVTAALIPMIPLLGTAIPLQEIVSKLAELMV
jgi:hypothetical protein